MSSPPFLSVCRESKKEKQYLKRKGIIHREYIRQMPKGEEDEEAKEERKTTLLGTSHGWAQIGFPQGLDGRSRGPLRRFFLDMIHG